MLSMNSKFFASPMFNWGGGGKAGRYHETTRFYALGRGRLGVAVQRPCARAGHAGDRISQQRLAKTVCSARCCLSQRFERAAFLGRSERQGRGKLGGRR